MLEKTFESPLDCKETQPVHSKGDQPWDFFGRNDACYSWNSSTLSTQCEELTHWKRLWCWEGLGAGGEGNDRGWDGWMASLTGWTWVWVNSGSWWWTGSPGVLWFMASQRVGHYWATELNWTDRIHKQNSVGNIKEVSFAVITRKTFNRKYNLIFNLQCTERLHNEKNSSNSKE